MHNLLYCFGKHKKSSEFTFFLQLANPEDFIILLSKEMSNRHFAAYYWQSAFVSLAIASSSFVGTQNALTGQPG